MLTTSLLQEGVQQHSHLPNRAGLGQRGVLREFTMPSLATLDSLQEEAARQQHAVRETAAVVQSLLHQPPLQPRSVSTRRGESRTLDTGQSLFTFPHSLCVCKWAEHLQLAYV